MGMASKKNKKTRREGNPNSSFNRTNMNKTGSFHKPSRKHLREQAKEHDNE